MIIYSDTSTIENRFLGCLLGGAIGDSLGYPIEWMNLEDIKINGFVQAPRINSKGVSYVSDDTQMSILTAFGLCNLPIYLMPILGGLILCIMDKILTILFLN